MHCIFLISGYCGHYALYFTLCCLEMGRCEQPSQVVALLEKVVSVVDFWRRCVGGKQGEVKLIPLNVEFELP